MQWGYATVQNIHTCIIGMDLIDLPFYVDINFMDMNIQHPSPSTSQHYTTTTTYKAIYNIIIANILVFFYLQGAALLILTTKQPSPVALVDEILVLLVFRFIC